MEEFRGHGVILFDGVCNLCNHVVQFIIPRDPNRYYYFAALQSASGLRLMEHYHTEKKQIDIAAIQSVILIQNGRMYSHSTAALMLTRKLSGLWPAFYIFIVIPKFLRDPIYHWIARNRYKWFGQKASCMMPTPESKSRFLE